MRRKQLKQIIKEEVQNVKKEKQMKLNLFFSTNNESLEEVVGTGLSLSMAVLFGVLLAKSDIVGKVMSIFGSDKQTTYGLTQLTKRLNIDEDQRMKLTKHLLSNRTFVAALKRLFELENSEQVLTSTASMDDMAIIRNILVAAKNNDKEALDRFKVYGLKTKHGILSTGTKEEWVQELEAGKRDGRYDYLENNDDEIPGAIKRWLYRKAGGTGSSGDLIELYIIKWDGHEIMATTLQKFIDRVRQFDTKNRTAFDVFELRTKLLDIAEQQIERIFNQDEQDGISNLSSKLETMATNPSSFNRDMGGAVSIPTTTDSSGGLSQPAQTKREKGRLSQVKQKQR